jgi:pilus assembly protein Flp/PilA
MWNDLKTRMFLLIAPVRDEEGQAMVEYGLILALVSVAAVGALALIGTDIGTVFEKVTTELGKAL